MKKAVFIFIIFLSISNGADIELAKKTIRHYQNKAKGQHSFFLSELLENEVVYDSKGNVIEKNESKYYFKWNEENKDIELIEFFKNNKKEIATEKSEAFFPFGDHLFPFLGKGIIQVEKRSHSIEEGEKLAKECIPVSYSMKNQQLVWHGILWVGPDYMPCLLKFESSNEIKMNDITIFNQKYTVVYDNPDYQMLPSKFRVEGEYKTKFFFSTIRGKYKTHYRAIYKKVKGLLD